LAAKPIVAILMGSDSDLSVMAECARVLEGYGIAYDIRVLSAHRSPTEAVRYANAAVGRGPLQTARGRFSQG
jgi:phosphoribosylcarboxyaminoimidazole (NCAIR) mutase